ICTLWLADWYLERGRWPEDLERAQDLLVWVAERALPSGVLAEQVHPRTGAPLSVSPLTWSHAEFVGTVHRFLDSLRRRQVRKTDPRAVLPEWNARPLLIEPRPSGQVPASRRDAGRVVGRPTPAASRRAVR